MAQPAPINDLLIAMHGLNQHKTPASLTHFKTTMGNYITSIDFQACMKGAEPVVCKDLMKHLENIQNLTVPSIDDMMLTFTKILLVLLNKPNKFGLDCANAICHSLLQMIGSLPDTIQNDEYRKMANQMFQPITYLDFTSLTQEKLNNFTQKLKDYNASSLNLSEAANLRIQY